ncbi:lasso peptide isopeptide bond-forming cyclase [Actinoallomurus vinaceus]|uniref:asparagine synthase (glutamine-hydrolyzing) n=1 Tax=Actinoallomurus vinaceus TaxID=1080074 RepID=A0ABP8U8D6_9ACTN
MQFLVFPDSVAGAAVADAVPDRTHQTVIVHPSGRPWIIGRWRDGEIVLAAEGPRRLALLGHTSVTPQRLSTSLQRIRTVSDLDALAGTVPGSFHLVAALDGVVRVQGSISSARQVFYGSIAGTTVAADRPQCLSALTGSGIAEELLPVRLLAPWPPWPLSERCLWRGIDALGMGHYLEMSQDGRARTVRWWSPPEPSLPLEAAAERVRAALSDAVAARAGSARTISADLSGGMDSTSLCFLAADRTDHLVTTRWEAADPADEDQAWAGRAAAALPDARHLVLARSSAPVWFAGLTEPDPDIEAPFAWIRTRARLAYMARQVAEHGSATHLTGHGGDELFSNTPLYLHTLARTNPLRAVRYLRANRAIYRWPAGATVRALLNRSSFGHWLATSAESLIAPVREFGVAPEFGWGISYRSAPWASGDAIAAARRQLREAALSDPEPLAPLRAQHAALQDVRLCGDTLRRVDRHTCRFGVSWHAPFVDDRVVEAALSVRFEDCAMPDRYKPVLTAAMRGIVPDHVLGRSTKSEYSADAYAGLRRHRTELLDLCDDMRLARLGLVDARVLRSTLESLPHSSITLMPLISTFACEIWLRSLPATSRVADLSGGRR